WLDERGMIHPSVREAVLPIICAPYVFPSDILDAIKSDMVAWKNYEKLSEPYKRIRIAYIDAARKRPDEFKKRLESFIKKTRDEKLIVGFGGIDKYYS
ncbi:MAG: YdeI/OmpD-associated family protein, partial [Clostridia bacterium]|nr:YdeI/OmpD-associated family protein [Clostridia bacterium]